MRQVYAYVCTGSDCKLKQIILFSSLSLLINHEQGGKRKCILAEMLFVLMEKVEKDLEVKYTHAQPPYMFG